MPAPGEATRRESRAPRQWLRITSRFLTDLGHWIETDRGTALRLVRLLHEIQRDPFSGTGKPERLRHNLRGCWSRRLTEKHRVLYDVSDEHVDLLSARHHYEN